jgi:hypothetical protein
MNMNYILLTTDGNKGVGLFKVLEDKLIQDLAYLRQHAAKQVIHDRLRRRRLLEGHDTLDDAKILEAAYAVAARTKIHVFISSDNEEGKLLSFPAALYYCFRRTVSAVKEALARYLKDHEHIEVMRVKNKGIIVHAKNAEYLKHHENNTGVADLVLDW